jgi:hypothetical protein
MLLARGCRRRSRPSSGGRTYRETPHLVTGGLLLLALSLLVALLSPDLALEGARGAFAAWVQTTAFVLSMVCLGGQVLASALHGPLAPAATERDATTEGRG